jgi:hypothetical protein
MSKEIQIIYKFGQIRKVILEQLGTVQNKDLRNVFCTVDDI